MSDFVRFSLKEWLMDKKRRQAGMRFLEFVGSVSKDALKEFEAERRKADRDWLWYGFFFKLLRDQENLWNVWLGVIEGKKRLFPF